MTDVHLDTSTGDLALSDDGDDLVLVDGLLELAQRVLLTLDVRRGEWAFDQRLGLPYERLFVRAPDLRSIAAELEDLLLALDGVDSVDPAELSLNRATRSLTATLRLQSSFGEVVLVTDPPEGEASALTWRAVFHSPMPRC